MVTVYPDMKFNDQNCQIKVALFLFLFLLNNAFVAANKLNLTQKETILILFCTLPTSLP